MILEGGKKVCLYTIAGFGAALPISHHVMI